MDEEKLLTLLLTLKHTYMHDYYSYQEGETEDNYKERGLKAMGFIHALKIVEEYITRNTKT